MTKKEKEKIEYLNYILNYDYKIDKEKEELIYIFIYNILTSNSVMNRYDCSLFGNIEENKTIGLNECINLIGRKIANKK